MEWKSDKGSGVGLLVCGAKIYAWFRYEGILYLFNPIFFLWRGVCMFQFGGLVH